MSTSNSQSGSWVVVAVIWHAALLVFLLNGPIHAFVFGILAFWIGFWRSNNIASVKLCGFANPLWSNVMVQIFSLILSIVFTLLFAQGVVSFFNHLPFFWGVAIVLRLIASGVASSLLTASCLKE